MERKFKKGDEVYTKVGHTLTVEGYVEGSDGVLARYHEHYEDGEGERWTDAGDMLGMFKEEELLDEYPKLAIPQYLVSQVEGAKRQVKNLRAQAEAIREEVGALRKEKWKLEAEAGKYPKYVERQLRLMERHLAGEDLLVCWEQYGKVSMVRMSELVSKDNDIRMVGIYGKYGTRYNNKWMPLYDWSVHQYSDDSGARFLALVATDEAEMLVRIREHMDERWKADLSFEARTLRAFKELGVELNEKEVKLVDEADANQRHNEQVQRERALVQLRKTADRLGVAIQE